MTEIATEDDLWKLFFNNPEDHTAEGDGFIPWTVFRQVIEAKTFGNGTEPLRLAATDRFYRVVRWASRRELLRRRSLLLCDAVVPQRDLRRVGKSMVSGDADLIVGYLGTSLTAAIRD